MKVIMLKDVGGVGQRGTVKEVNDGYGMNFLIARGLAVQASPEKIAEVQRKDAAEAEALAAREEKVAQVVRAAEGKTVTMSAKANEKGHLFKGIHKDEIAKAFSDALGGPITPDMLHSIDNVIRESGEHSVKLKGGGAESSVTLDIKAT